MALSKDTFCPECHVCRSRPYLGEFEKILEHDDVGISIYRYKVPERGYERRKEEPREIFILQTAKNVVELNLDIFAKEFAKCKTYCPRCKEMMRRAETLFKDVPSVHKLGVMGLCGHVSKEDYFYCPPCRHIVDKFLMFTAEDALKEDPECTRLQTYLKRSTTQAKPPLFEDAVKSAVALQIQETAEIKIKQDKENMDPEKKSKKAQGSAKTSSKSKLNKELRSKTLEPTGSVLVKKQKAATGKGRDKSKEPGKFIKENLNDKATQTRTTSEDRKYDQSMNIMRMLIAEQLKEKLEIERNKRDLAKQKVGIERQAVEAEKKIEEAERKAKEAEEARQLRLRALLEEHAQHDVVSLDHVPSVIDECSNAPDGVYNMIRGEKIYRTSADQHYEQAALIIAPKLKAPQMLTAPQMMTMPPPPPSSPTEHTAMTLYQMRPAQPEFDWFELNKHKGRMLYDSGELLAQFDEDGSARVFYRSGEVALDCYAAQESYAGQRLVVHSSGERERTVLAMFDYAGNGIVFDHAGNVRLKYNQTEGIVLDPSLGPQTHWKWHSLNDSPALRSVMVDNKLHFKDPYILQLGKHEEDSKTSLKPDESDMRMKNIEMQNAFKAKRTQLGRKFKPYQIKMKAMKINEHFSLRILEQSAVYLFYSDGKTRLKINMGLILDPTTIIDQDVAEVGDVANSLDRLPASSGSVEALQRIVRRTRTKERLRIARERRVNPPDPWENVDLVNRSRSVSPPPQTPISCRRFSSVCGDATTRFCPTQPSPSCSE